MADTEGRLGRPREFNVERALADITRVFWQHGFEGASMAQLVAESGVQKASLYAAFGDKRSLYILVLSAYVDELIETVDGVLGPGHVRDRFGRFFRGAVTRVSAGDRRGCFLCCAASDQAALDDEVGDVVRAGLKRLEAVIGEALRDSIPMRPERTRVARRLLGVYVSLHTLARAGHPAAALETIVADAIATVPLRSG